MLNLTKWKTIERIFETMVRKPKNKNNRNPTLIEPSSTLKPGTYHMIRNTKCKNTCFSSHVFVFKITPLTTCSRFTHTPRPIAAGHVFTRGINFSVSLARAENSLAKWKNLSSNLLIKQNSTETPEQFSKTSNHPDKIKQIVQTAKVFFSLKFFSCFVE